MNVKFVKLDPRAKTPTYGTEFSAGADLYAITGGEKLIKAGETQFVSTGLSIEIPTGYVGLVYARSGLACKKGLAPANKVGVIDSDYRGEIRVGLCNFSGEPYTVSPGERIAQLVLHPVLLLPVTEVDTLDETERGTGGFGSTGKGV